ncbi:DMT family transporter [uncultured Fusobacterium sp.]|jgi:drug/metabolite transporter (DMT)-like permease|uniref:DMT family transporter n=1 Tax=uncultured Fusobacterium sp. TaxID=159267 RepID=UPI002805AE8F|nr:DMT family transporter [uncultured Fusobacterium sp.]
MFKKKGLLYAILASVLWAIVNPVIKTGLSYDMTPMNFAGLRFTSVGIILLAYTWHKGMWEEVRKNSKLFTLLTLVNIFLGYAAFYIGVNLVDGAISSIIMGTTPFVNIILSHIMTKNDKLNKHKVISILISLVGLLMIIGVKSGGYSINGIGLIGIGLLFMNIIFQGYSAIKVAEYKANIDPVFLNAVQMFFGGFLLYVTGVAIEGYKQFIGKPIGFYLSLGTLVFVSVFAFSFWFIALQDKNTKVSEVNMCRLINPILGAILSWIMLPDEVPTFNTVAGMIIIVFSLVFYFKGKEYFEKNR